MAGGTGIGCGSDRHIERGGALNITQGVHTFEPGQKVMLSSEPRWEKVVGSLLKKVGDGLLTLEMVASVEKSTLSPWEKCGVGHHQILTVRLANGDVEIFSGALVVPYEKPKRKSLGFLVSALIFLVSGIVSFIIFNSNYEFSILESVFWGLGIGLSCVFVFNMDFSDPDRDPNDAAYM
jgi:hypothetical protein